MSKSEHDILNPELVWESVKGMADGSSLIKGREESMKSIIESCEWVHPMYCLQGSTYEEIGSKEIRIISKQQREWDVEIVYPAGLHIISRIVYQEIGLCLVAVFFLSRWSVQTIEGRGDNACHGFYLIDVQKDKHSFLAPNNTTTLKWAKRMRSFLHLKYPDPEQFPWVADVPF